MNSIITTRQQDTLKGWIHSVRKKTTRISTRITAKLGLISLTRDEEFERHYETFKHIEKTIRNFIKNLNSFVDHFEHFLISLQQTSDGLGNFYRDKSYLKDIEDLKRTNKILACQYFNSFKKTIDENVITIVTQLLQRFTIPHQLIHKRNAKLLDYDNKTRELDSCRDEAKKATLKDQFVIAKDIYEKLNKQLIEQLPIFNQISLHIFKECIIDLLENRQNLIESYANQVSGLLNTPLLINYANSGVAESLLNENGAREIGFDMENDNNKLRLTNGIESDRETMARYGGSSGQATALNSSSSNHNQSGSHSPSGQLGFDAIARAVANREISSSTPLPPEEQNDISLEQASLGVIHPPQDLPNMLPSTNYDNEIDNDRDTIRNGLNNGGNVRIDEIDGMHNVSIRAASRRDLNTSKNLNQSINSRTSKSTLLTNNGGQKKRKHKFPTYIAVWQFDATDKNQLTIVPNQELKVIKACDENGNNEWSLCRDKWSRVGYVPSAYIKKKIA